MERAWEHRRLARFSHQDAARFHVTGTAERPLASANPRQGAPAFHFHRGLQVKSRVPDRSCRQCWLSYGSLPEPCDLIHAILDSSVSGSSIPSAAAFRR